jgi:hypothetical protein
VTPATDDETSSPFEIELDGLLARMNTAVEQQLVVLTTKPVDWAAITALSAEYFAAMNDFEEFSFGTRPVPEDWWRRPALGSD